MVTADFPNSILSVPAIGLGSCCAPQCHWINQCLDFPLRDVIPLLQSSLSVVPWWGIMMGDGSFHLISKVLKWWKIQQPHRLGKWTNFILIQKISHEACRMGQVLSSWKKWFSKWASMMWKTVSFRVSATPLCIQIVIDGDPRGVRVKRNLTSHHDICPTNWHRSSYHLPHLFTCWDQSWWFTQILDSSKNAMVLHHPKVCLWCILGHCRCAFGWLYSRLGHSMGCKLSSDSHAWNAWLCTPSTE